MNIWKLYFKVVLYAFLPAILEGIVSGKDKDYQDYLDRLNFLGRYLSSALRPLAYYLKCIEWEHHYDDLWNRYDAGETTVMDNILSLEADLAV